MPQIIDVEQGSQLVWQIRKARSCWKAVNKFFCILYLIHITRKTNTLCTLYNYWHRTRKSAGWFDKSGKARSWDGCSRHPISCLNAQYISSTVLPFKTNKGISTCRDGVSVIGFTFHLWSSPKSKFEANLFYNLSNLHMTVFADEYLSLKWLVTLDGNIRIWFWMNSSTSIMKHSTGVTLYWRLSGDIDDTHMGHNAPCIHLGKAWEKSHLILFKKFKLNG